jgi:hypothetical protein
MGIYIDEALEALEDQLSPEDYQASLEIYAPMLKVFYGKELSLRSRLAILHGRMEQFMDALQEERFEGGSVWIDRAVEVAVRDKRRDSTDRPSFAQMDVSAKALIKNRGEAEDKREMIDFNDHVEVIQDHEAYEYLLSLGKEQEEDKDTLAELFRQTVNAVIAGDNIKTVGFQGKKADDEDVEATRQLRRSLREWFPTQH